MNAKPVQQLELCLNSRPPRMVRRRPSRRLALNRAQWWFREMHRVVDLALDCPSILAGRGEQESLPLAMGRSRRG